MYVSTVVNRIFRRAIKENKGQSAMYGINHYSFGNCAMTDFKLNN